MRLRTSYICQQCSYSSPQWYGKCPNCAAWNSLVETVVESSIRQLTDKSQISNKFQTQNIKPQKLSDVKHIEANRLKTGLMEFDRVLGGGIVPGSVTLLTGDPGIGKSTLLLYVLSSIGGVYVAGEESAEQIKLRSSRMGINGENITILSEISVENILSHLTSLGDLGRNLVIVDSIQTLVSDELVGMAGSVGQVRHCAELLVQLAKSRGTPIILIGHVTKEGTIAGPKVLEHMVDTVLYLEGERFASARILRTLKNRFGATEEVGIFDMQEKGLKEITNPSEIFLQDRVKNVPGSVVTVIMEGTRPLLVEIQALVIPSQLQIPRRVVSGVDFNRLQLILAVLQKRLNIPLGTFDVFVNVSGGLKISEPAADLALAVAIISSFKNKALDPKAAVFGEIGLLGEIRRTTGIDRRTNEAKRLGFTNIISPSSVTSLSAVNKALFA